MSEIGKPLRNSGVFDLILNSFDDWSVTYSFKNHFCIVFDLQIRHFMFFVVVVVFFLFFFFPSEDFFYFLLEKILYHICPNYSDRKASANYVDPVQTVRVYSFCRFIRT